METSRRSVLKAGLASTAAVAGLSVPALTTPTTAAATAVRQDPFTLGVASGDPWPDGFVLWTRLAVDPLADDGLGGMPSRAYVVQWQVATDERFHHIVRSGVAVARPEHAHSVHVTIDGLSPSREYWYRFRSEGHVSGTGRALTAPARGTTPRELAMSFVSCSQFEHGWFTAYRRLAEDRPDLVLHLGDYQYEYTKNTYVAPGGNVRDHDGPETTDLASYRQRHAQYKSDLDLQAAHAVAPWLVVWDDHEVDNNWADETPEKPESGFLERRAAAFQAYYENMPLRASSKPRGIDMQLYRRVKWGELATFHMLDTRQYRTDQPCGDEFRSDCVERHDPAATLTGARQERWLLDGFAQSRARWDVLGQQVFFSQVELTAGPGRGFNPDAWDGYTANRDRIVDGIVDSPVRNALILTGDVHSHWAADVRERPDDPSARLVATELVTTSITSGGDGSDSRDEIDAVRPENPDIRYFSNRRGYVRTRITPDEVRADFRVLPYVSSPGAPALTGASFVVADRDPTLRPV